MGIKISWSGLALLLVAGTFGLGHSFEVAGAILLVIGVVLQWLDR